MEPKSISFSAGAAVLVYYFLFTDAAEQLSAAASLSAVENIALSGLLLSALTAVITPFAKPGKAALERLTRRIENGPKSAAKKTPS